MESNIRHFASRLFNVTVGPAGQLAYHVRYCLLSLYPVSSQTVWYTSRHWVGCCPMFDSLGGVSVPHVLVPHASRKLDSHVSAFFLGNIQSRWFARRYANATIVSRNLPRSRWSVFPQLLGCFRIGTMELDVVHNHLA